METPRGQFHFDPDTYLELMRAEVPGYDELQKQVARASEGIAATEVLDLGVGTGETSRRVLAVHAAARLTGIDASERMLRKARERLPATQVGSLSVCMLQGPLPAGPYDLVISCLAVHHLDPPGKADLFRRVASSLRRPGRFVLGDVIVPENSEDAVTPLEPGVDLPDTTPDLLTFLRDAGFEARVAWCQQDLAVLVGDRV